MNHDKIYLVDASPYIFRAYFSIPPSVKTPDGRPKNALHGFSGFLLKLIADEGVRQMALTFDRSLTTSFRNEIYPDYKAQRDLPPEELKAQLGWCESLGSSLGIASYSDERYEADDLIATLCGPLVAEGRDVVVVTSDKDLAQLVGPRVELFDFAKDDRYGVDEVVEKFGVRPQQIPDYLGLAGDSVDNIPGVSGVGKKTAVSLLEHFDSLEAVYEDLETVKSLPIRGAKSLAAKLDAQREIAFLSKSLATVATDAPISAELDDLALKGPNEDVFDPLVDALGIERFAERARTLFETFHS